MSYLPDWITIEVTSACNNKCQFCSYHGEAAEKKSNVYNISYMLSYEDFKKMVDMACCVNIKNGNKFKKNRVRHIHVCGTGEPFLNPKILDMLDYVIYRYGTVSFQSNFWKTLFDKNDYLNQIIKRKDAISYIATDICSGIPEQHERIKNGSSWNETVEALAYISKNTDIRLIAFLILTRENYKGLRNIIDEFEKYKINNYEISIGNLMSYNYSRFTSNDNVYISTDTEITEALLDVQQYGKEKGIYVSIPKPVDYTEHMCDVFWTKFQTWPVKGCDDGRRGENMIPHACNEVVNGEINTLGYLFDYENMLDAWNSEKLVEIRHNLLKGIYPSEYCKDCYLYHEKDGYFKQKVRNKQYRMNV